MGLGIGLAAAGAALFARRAREFRLSTRMRLESVVADLATEFERASVLEEPRDAPVRLSGLRPGWNVVVNAAYRRAIVAPPPSELRFRVRVPSQAALRFGVGIEPAEGRGRDSAGVRFVVSVDRGQAFSRTLNPAARRRDRRWFDERLDLGSLAGREVEIALRTEAVGTGPLAGTPGWSHPRLVHERWLDRQPASASAPNVLLLLVDTLRADRLGCYGANPTLTPTLDRLAETGTVFENAIAQAPWTLPSVATIFTGLHVRSHGVAGVLPDGAKSSDVDPGFLSDRLPTLAERAQEAGITTVGVSANPLIARGTNLARGFETFVEFGWDKKIRNWPAAAEINETLLRWLRENRRGRFFAYVHYMDVHDPYTPPAGVRPPPPPSARKAVIAGDVESVTQKLDGTGGVVLTEAEVAYLRALYDAEVRAWDVDLARLLDGLSALGLLDSTVVVVTADHGEEFREHGRLKHGAHLYDELLRVPLVIHGPGISTRRIAQQAQGIDLFPTVAGLLGFPAPPGLPGLDVFALSKDRPVFSETRFGNTPPGSPTELISVRTSGWKLIYAPALGYSELYDLARDPGERVDRSRIAAEGNALAELLSGWSASAPPPPRSVGHDPSLREKLRALGYVQ